MRVAELPHVPFDMLVGGLELLVGHIDADNLAALAHKLCDQIDIAAGARSKVEDAAALKRCGNDDAAAIIFGLHLFMHIGERRLEEARHAAAVAAG